MQTSLHSSGYHCHKFDTDLLQRVIEMSVDESVRQVCQDRRISLDSIDQRVWVQTILRHIEGEIMRLADAHVLIPSEINARIETEVAELVDGEIQKQKPCECASIMPPVHGLSLLPRHAGVFLRRLFKKHTE